MIPFNSLLIITKIQVRLFVGNNSIILLLEPLDGVFAADLVVLANGRLASLSASNTGTGTVHDNVEVHAVNSDIRVVLNTQVNVLGNTEAKVTSLREVSVSELVFLDLKTTLKNLLSLRATDSDVDSNLFVSSDAKGSDSVSGLGVDGGLTGKLLQHLSSTGKSVTRLTDTDVKGQLLNAQLTHRVGTLVTLSKLCVSINARRIIKPEVSRECGYCSSLTKMHLLAEIITKRGRKAAV